jgi:prolyl 4-hydroxylase
LTLLQRLTQQPSPVSIPPNEISLTYLHAFLTGDECKELVALSQGCFFRSSTTLGLSDIRTSFSAELSSSHALVRVVRQRVTELTGATDTHIQQLYAVRYEPGQQFTPHFDSNLTLAAAGCLREFTLFVYLNTMTPDAGGETEFTKLGVKFAPKTGDALFWRNHKDRNSPHFLDGEHAGRPPLSGVKYGQSAPGWTAIHSSQRVDPASCSLYLSSFPCALIKV